MPLQKLLKLLEFVELANIGGNNWDTVHSWAHYLRRSAIAAPAKDRRPAQRRREFLTLLAALPSRSWRVFSDGSSFDSTRAGAGY